MQGSEWRLVQTAEARNFGATEPGSSGPTVKLVQGGVFSFIQADLVLLHQYTAANMTSYEAAPWVHSMTMSKFMLSVGPENFRLLVNAAEQRGISVQELLRAVIIPDWAHENASETIKPYVGPLEFASRIREWTPGRYPA